MLLSTLQYIPSLIHNLLPPSLPLFCSSAPGLPKHVEEIIRASVPAVILVVAFILLTVAAGYYYYRKNKVVIVKVCVRRAPHMTCVSTCRCVSSVTRQSRKIQCSLFGRVIYCKYVYEMIHALIFSLKVHYIQQMLCTTVKHPSLQLM